MKIYTDRTTSVDVTVSEGNKWYSYVLPKDKGLYKIESGYYDDENGDWYNGIVTKAVVKANVTTTNGRGIIPSSTVEASFKGSNTSKVTDMRYFFKECSGLTSLDVSSFDTSNVTMMFHMFYFCRNLTSLTLSNFNTSNVTDMGKMFCYCSGLTSLDLSGWDISKVTQTGSMYNMFHGCTALKEIKMIGCTQHTIDKIKAQLTEDNITGFTIITE